VLGMARLHMHPEKAIRDRGDCRHQRISEPLRRAADKAARQVLLRRGQARIVQKFAPNQREGTELSFWARQATIGLKLVSRPGERCFDLF
jgi:hypothetical protein